jgi:hypothetical protein
MLYVESRVSNDHEPDRHKGDKNIRSMGGLQVLVEAVALGNELLLPLSESLLFDLDLLGEALPEVLFLFLELGVVQLPGTGLAELPGLHLLGPVGFVVALLGGVDEIQHVCPDEDGAEFLEVAVFLVLHLGDTPGVLSALDNVAVARLDILLRANNGKWHGSHQAASVLGSLLVVLLDGWLVDLNSLGLDNGLNLAIKSKLIYL